MSRRSRLGEPLTELPFTDDRFDEITAEVGSNVPLSENTRAEVSQLLEFLWIVISHNRRRKNLGKPADLAAWQRAELVRILIARHGCSPDVAVFAVIPNGTEKDSRALRKSVSRLEESGGKKQNMIIQVDPAELSMAEARLLRQK